MPIYSVFLVLGIGLLSYLQVSNSAAVVLSWFVSLVTASQLINFSVMALTFISFHRALAAQGIPRVKPHLPYIGWFQPYLAYYALSLTSVMSVVGGYTVFLPGRWDVPTFIFSYFMIFLFPIVFVGWKFYSKSVWLMNKPEQIVLGGKEKEEVDAYEREYVESPPRSKLIKWWDFIFG